jgi:hypothetical protein
MNMIAFWDVALFGLVEVYRHSGPDAGDCTALCPRMLLSSGYEKFDKFNFEAKCHFRYTT